MFQDLNQTNCCVLTTLQRVPCETTCQFARKLVLPPMIQSEHNRPSDRENVLHHPNVRRRNQHGRSHIAVNGGVSLTFTVDLLGRAYTKAGASRADRQWSKWGNCRVVVIGVVATLLLCFLAPFILQLAPKSQV